MGRGIVGVSAGVGGEAGAVIVAIGDKMGLEEGWKEKTNEAGTGEERNGEKGEKGEERGRGRCCVRGHGEGHLAYSSNKSGMWSSSGVGEKGVKGHILGVGFWSLGNWFFLAESTISSCQIVAIDALRSVTDFSIFSLVLLKDCKWCR